MLSVGLHHLGARLYDPVIGRFLSRDPLLIPRTAATTNPYAFALNDPVNSADPTGLDCAYESQSGCYGGGGDGGGGGSDGDGHQITWKNIKDAGQDLIDAPGDLINAIGDLFFSGDNYVPVDPTQARAWETTRLDSSSILDRAIDRISHTIAHSFATIVLKELCLECRLFERAGKNVYGIGRFALNPSETIKIAKTLGPGALYDKRSTLRSDVRLGSVDL